METRFVPDRPLKIIVFLGILSPMAGGTATSWLHHLRYAKLSYNPRW